jgi:hypothetical protein
MELGKSRQSGPLHLPDGQQPDLHDRHLLHGRAHWYQEEIDIAFQMDGNNAQQPYNVWLDEVNLLAH